MQSTQRNVLQLGTVVSVVALLAGVTIPAFAFPPGPPNRTVTSSVMLPVDGLSFRGSTDVVALTGRVHVVTHIPGNPVIPGNPIEPIAVFVNLADVHGVSTQCDTQQYIAVGAFDGTLTRPTDPVFQFQINPSFTIMPIGHPPSPCASTNPLAPITFRLMLNFDTDGNLLEIGTNVTIPDSNF